MPANQHTDLPTIIRQIKHTDNTHDYSQRLHIRLRLDAVCITARTRECAGSLPPELPVADGTASRGGRESCSRARKSPESSTTTGDISQHDSTSHSTAHYTTRQRQTIVVIMKPYRHPSTHHTHHTRICSVHLYTSQPNTTPHDIPCHSTTSHIT